jgi:hypothetical protein
MNDDSFSAKSFSRSNLDIIARQLRAEATFRKVRDLFAKESIGILLLKGPHLGNTIYDSPKDRLYSDLDLLVRPSDFEEATKLLLKNDFIPFAFDKFTPEIQRDFKHWEFRSPLGILIELHRWLSGHDRFPIDCDDLFERSEKFRFGQVEAMGLGTEDLLLHLCLHMGTSYFHVIERKHVTDIKMLLTKRRLDWPIFLNRVKKAGTMAITYYALLSAKVQEKASVPDDALKMLCPWRLRRLWLEKYLDPTKYPIYRFPDHSRKMIKKKLLVPLLDRPDQWVGFLLRTIATNIRMFVRVVRSKLSKRCSGGQKTEDR